MSVSVVVVPDPELVSVPNPVPVPAQESEQKNGGRKGHIGYLDAVRVFAIYFVLQVHVIAKSPFQVDTKEISHFVFYGLERSCVPLFFMVSGVCLLPRRETLTNLYKRRIFQRILIPLIFWAVVYKIYNLASNPTRFSSIFTPTASTSDWLIQIRKLVTLEESYHFWYLFALISMYVQLPLFRLVWQNAEDKIMQYLLCLWLLSRLTLAPFNPLSLHSNFKSSYNSNLNEDETLNIHKLAKDWTGINFLCFPASASLAGYLFLGAWLHSRYSEKMETWKKGIQPKLVLWGGILITVVTGALVAVEQYEFKKTVVRHDGEDLDSPWTHFDSPLIIIQSAAVFITLMMWNSDGTSFGVSISETSKSILSCGCNWIPNNFHNKAITWFSQCSYGTYLSHALILEILKQFLKMYSLIHYVPVWLFVPGTTLFILLVSSTLTFCLMKIPGLKKIV